MSEKIFALTHEYPVGGKCQYTEMKVLGYFSSREKANEKIDLYVDLPGFRDYGRECFIIHEYEIGMDYQKEGFVVKR